MYKLQPLMSGFDVSTSINFIEATSAVIRRSLLTPCSSTQENRPDSKKAIGRFDIVSSRY